MFTDIGQGKKNMESYEGREKIIFFLGAKPGDKNFLQTNRVFLSLNHVHKKYSVLAYNGFKFKD